MNFSAPALWLPFLVGGGLLGLSIWLAFKGGFYRRWCCGCALLLSSGLLCLEAGEIYARVDQSGNIHEAGLVLPLGAVFFLSGIALVAALSVFQALHLKRRHL
jgi:hypothetical protein